MKAKFFVCICVTLLSFSTFSILAASPQITKSSQTEIQTKIHSVENGLKTGIQVEGQNAFGMNIIDRMKYYKVPGLSIAIINDGKIEWEKAYNIASKNVVTTKTIFQAGSISKPISAVVALSLVEKNQVNLDQNVNNILRTWKVPDNEYTETEKVTLRRLLSHTAGLNVHGFEGYSSSLEKQDLPTIIQILNGEKPGQTMKSINEILEFIHFVLKELQE